MRELERTKRDEGKAICKVLGLDCRGQRTVERKAIRRAQTLAELLRVYVERELRLRRS